MSVCTNLTINSWCVQGQWKEKFYIVC